jgi:DNA-binding NarL/FixJ family response regulator
MIRIVIADDHHLVREGIRSLLDDCDDIEVIGEAATGHEAIELAQTHEPNVVVMDISMPRMDGSQASERILALDKPIEIVVLSMHSDVVLAQQLIRGGVKGYLLKNSIADELPMAVRSASQGKLYISPAISDSVMTALMEAKSGEAPEGPADRLTAREREVLQLIAEGHTNKEIGQILTISVKTVEKHRANLMSKLDVHDLPTLMRTAIKLGLIYLEE